MSLMRDKPFLAPGQRDGKRARGRGRRREELSQWRLPQVRWDCRRAKKTQASSAKVKERNRVTGPQVGTDAQAHRTAYDAVGRWLTNHPAPLWLVNNPAKKWVATRSAGNYDREVVRSTLASLVGEDAVVVFSATYCPFSLAAKRTLAAQGVQFKVIEWNKRDDGAALHRRPRPALDRRHRPRPLPVQGYRRGVALAAAGRRYWWMPSIRASKQPCMNSIGGTSKYFHSIGDPLHA